MRGERSDRTEGSGRKAGWCKRKTGLEGVRRVLGLVKEGTRDWCVKEVTERKEDNGTDKKGRDEDVSERCKEDRTAV